MPLVKRKLPKTMRSWYLSHCIDGVWSAVWSE